MLLYLTHEADFASGKRMADEGGLSDYFGYQPLFATRMNPDSVADTWGQVFMRPPLGFDVIEILEVEDDAVTPLDVSAYELVRRLSGGACDLNAPGLPELLFHQTYPERTLFLLDPDFDPLRSWRFNVRDFRPDKACDLALDYNLSLEQEGSLRFCLTRVASWAQAQKRRATQGPSPSTPDDGIFYRSLMLSGVIPFLWGLATDRSVTRYLYDIEPTVFADTPSLSRSHVLDEDADESSSCDLDELRARSKRRYQAFVDGLNEIAHLYVMEWVEVHHVGRNEACFCGSGRKLKKCCLRAGIDHLALTWPDTLGA